MGKINYNCKGVSNAYSFIMNGILIATLGGLAYLTIQAKNSPIPGCESRVVATSQSSSMPASQPATRISSDGLDKKVK